MTGTTDFPGSADDFSASSPAKQNIADSTGRLHGDRHDDMEAAMEAVQTHILESVPQMFSQTSAPAAPVADRPTLWWDTDATPTGGGGGGGGAAPRTTTSVTTGSLAADASETGTITLAPSYRLMRISTSAAARVRLYISTATRTADSSRSIGVDPTGDHGVVLDFVTTSLDMDWALTPTVDGFIDGSGSAVPYSIINMSGSTAAITVTFTWVLTENAP